MARGAHPQLTLFNIPVIFSEWSAAFRDRHPRGTALLILGLLLGIVCFDALRLTEARNRLPGTEWSQGLVSGATTGVLLLLIAAALWFVARRYQQTRALIEIVAAVVGVLLFVVTHPRHGDDAVGDLARVGLLLGVDMLFIGLLIYAASNRWRQSPVSRRGRGSAP